MALLFQLPNVTRAKEGDPCTHTLLLIRYRLIIRINLVIW